MGRKYDNRVAARSLMTMGPYRPLKRLKEIQVPILLLGATEDTVAPFVASAISKVNNAYITVETVKANHFEPYFEPVFSEVIRKELEFLKSLHHTTSNRPRQSVASLACR